LPTPHITVVGSYATGLTLKVKRLPREKVARDLIGMGVSKVVMTLGERGALIVTETTLKQIPAIQVSAVDATGTGDAFNAGLATALACGEGLESAVDAWQSQRKV
jgi:sugar/nucleoside kinase (ribokinase family)